MKIVLKCVALFLPFAATVISGAYNEIGLAVINGTFCIMVFIVIKSDDIIDEIRKK